MAERLQINFLAAITQKFRKKSDAVDEISSLLNIGKDAVYRRLRGDSELTLEQLFTLANKFSVSVDQIIFENSKNALFTINSFKNPVHKFDDYLLGLISSLETGLSLPNAKITYATAEIPLFLYGMFPEIMCFKLYVWGKTVWNMDHILRTPFSFDLFSPYTMDLIKESSDKYMNIKTTELWCLNIFDNTLNQIEFVMTNGNFKNGTDALLICDALTDFSKHVCRMAETGKKFTRDSNPEHSDIPFELFHNELVFTNNTVLLKSENLNAVYSTFDSPNFLMSTDKRLFEHTERWLHGIKQKSDYITEVSEKNRNLFFNRLEKKVAKTRMRLQTLMDIME